MVRKNQSLSMRGRRGRRNAPKHTPMVFSTKVSNRHAQPRPVATDLVCTTRQEAYVTWTSTVTPPVAGTISAKTLLDTISGTSSVWDKVQFKKFDIYAGTDSPTATVPNPNQWPSLTVTLNSSGVSGFAASDKPTFYCDPVPGQRRAHLSIKPNTLFTESWIDGSNTEPILTIQTEPISEEEGTYSYEVYIQFTVVLRSTSGTFSPASLAAATAAHKSLRLRAGPDAIPVTITHLDASGLPVTVVGSSQLQTIVVNQDSQPVPTKQVTFDEDAEEL